MATPMPKTPTTGESPPIPAGWDCENCSGTGACDVCDGYGYSPPIRDSTNGEGPECDTCFGNGLCVECSGTGH